MAPDRTSDPKRAPQPSALMVGQLANDLRKLLMVMVSCVDSLRGRVEPASDTDLVFAEIDGTIDSAFHLARELVDIARPSRLTAAVIDLNELVTQARGVIERILGDTIKLTLNLTASSPMVQAEAVQLEWLLMNIASNAYDAMPEGGHLAIETVSVEPAFGGFARRQVCLTAVDSGTGMTPDVLNRALEPFFTTKEDRAGLGLTSVALTVRRLGGTLHMRRGDPNGTRVTIYLPVLGRKEIA